MPFVVDCILSQHQHSRSMSTAPALSLIKEWRFQRLIPPQHVRTFVSQTPSSCDLISHHLRGSRKSYLGRKLGLKTEWRTERKVDNAGKRQCSRLLLEVSYRTTMSKHNTPNQMSVNKTHCSFSCMLAKIPFRHLSSLSPAQGTILSHFLQCSQQSLYFFLIVEWKTNKKLKKFQRVAANTWEITYWKDGNRSTGSLPLIFNIKWQRNKCSAAGRENR